MGIVCKTWDKMLSRERKRIAAWHFTILVAATYVRYKEDVIIIFEDLIEIGELVVYRNKNRIFV